MKCLFSLREETFYINITQIALQVFTLGMLTLFNPENLLLVTCLDKINKLMEICQQFGQPGVILTLDL